MRINLRINIINNFIRPWSYTYVMDKIIQEIELIFSSYNKLKIIKQLYNDVYRYVSTDIFLFLFVLDFRNSIAVSPCEIIFKSFEGFVYWRSSHRKFTTPICRKLFEWNELLIVRRGPDVLREGEVKNAARPIRRDRRTCGLAVESSNNSS